MKISVRSGFFFAFVFLMVVSGCGPAPTPPPPTPTATRTPIPPTSTTVPTATATPDVAATQRADSFNTLLNSFVEQGFLDSAAGDILQLNPTEADWKTGSWSPSNIPNAPKDYTDFLFSAHFAWEPVKDNPQSFGCAVVFGLQQDATNAQFILQFNKSAISLSWLKQPVGSQFPYLYQIGKSGGTGRVDFKEKTQTDFAVLLRGQSLYVSFDNAVSKYTIAKDRPTKGALILGSNFGPVPCTMTNMMLWSPK